MVVPFVPRHIAPHFERGANTQWDQMIALRKSSHPHSSRMTSVLGVTDPIAIVAEVTPTAMDQRRRAQVAPQCSSKRRDAPFKRRPQRAGVFEKRRPPEVNNVTAVRTERQR
jgi:hypothetical protein